VVAEHVLEGVGPVLDVCEMCGLGRSGNGGTHPGTTRKGVALPCGPSGCRKGRRERAEGREGRSPESVRARRATDQGARIHEDGTPEARDPPEGDHGDNAPRSAKFPRAGHAQIFLLHSPLGIREPDCETYMSSRSEIIVIWRW
jgi:hypothetical protein